MTNPRGHYWTPKDPSKNLDFSNPENWNRADKMTHPKYEHGEPWQFHVGDQHIFAAYADGDDAISAHPDDCEPLNRAIHCVNALAGVPDEVVEKGGATLAVYLVAKLGLEEDIRDILFGRIPVPD